MKLLYPVLSLLLLLQVAEAQQAQARPQRVRRRRELVHIVAEEKVIPSKLAKLDNSELIARLLQDGSMSM